MLLNDGSGTFGNRIDYETDDGTYSVLTMDVNEDGELDLITANNYADSVSVLYSNFPPSITVIEPDGANDAANAQYTITWEDYYPYGEAIITLYWDNDDSGFDGTQITHSLSEDDDGIGGMYSWNTSLLPNGSYWIYAKIDDSVFAPVYDYGFGPLEINQTIITNTTPSFQIIEPDGEGDYADSEFTIMWMDSDPDDDASISLYYDDDSAGFDGVVIVSGLGEDAHGGSGFYNWNTNNITEGEYFIYGICDDGVNEPVSRYSSYPVIVNHTQPHNDPPFIQITEPDGNDDEVDSEFIITWLDSDADDDAQISLYYDSDSAGYYGILIADYLSEDENSELGAYVWNTTGLVIGEYWVYAEISDGVNEAVYNYSTGSIIINRSQQKNNPPSIQIIEPDGEGDFADSEFSIMWLDSDSDNDAAITLFYNEDNTDFNGTPIVSGLSEDANGNSGVYRWNTTNVPEGEYYILGIIEDGTNEAVMRYSDFFVIVDHTSPQIPEPPVEPPPPKQNNPPLIQIVEPDGESDSADSQYMITWIDSDSDDNAAISLYYDTDASGLDGTLIAIGIFENSHDNSGMYIWDTQAVPERDYYVYGVIQDGYETSSDYSQGMVTITHSTAINTAPNILILNPSSGIEAVDKNFSIQWVDSDPDDNAVISLYYDSDQNGHDGTLIVADLNEDDATDSFFWITENLTDGEYYIYAIIDDGTNNAVYDYSDGKISINRTQDGDQTPVEDPKGDQTSNQNMQLLVIIMFFIILFVVILKRERRLDKIKKESEEDEEDFQGEEEDDDLDDESFGGDEEGESSEPEEMESEEQEPPEAIEDDEIDEDLLPPPDD
jgi:hypothetical protein